MYNTSLVYGRFSWGFAQIDTFWTFPNIIHNLTIGQNSLDANNKITCLPTRFMNLEKNIMKCRKWMVTMGSHHQMGRVIFAGKNYMMKHDEVQSVELGPQAVLVSSRCFRYLRGGGPWPSERRGLVHGALLLRLATSIRYVMNQSSTKSGLGGSSDSVFAVLGNQQTLQICTCTYI